MKGIISVSPCWLAPALRLDLTDHLEVIRKKDAAPFFAVDVARYSAKCSVRS